MRSACWSIVLLLLGATAWSAEAPLNLPIAPGPFKPEFSSLAQYKCPEWFRDAKLGMWAHWGPQCVPMAGDWYARNMYMQGQRQYQDHLEHYGHPSKLGYKDIIPLWKAEKWDPERLMDLYQKAGARYFVSMGCHHDNFDLWNSRYHSYNAVKMGPKRDVVGDWQKAAKKRGMRFGVSEHMGASFTWFQESHKSDKTGPLAGVPYDGADPKYEELYHWPARPGDTGWYSNDPRWHAEWYRRIQDLLDQYQPDLLYTDGGVPFANEVGRSMIAHYYNADAGRRNGPPQVVYTCKQESKGMWIQDLERGVMAGVRPEPWQTDTSIGDWYYNKDWKYRGADWVIQMLVDIVSKNGNLLLNVVQRPDGTLDPEAERVLAEMADWMAINGEGIFETRPWMVHGEGPVRAKGGHFGEDFAYSARDVRFTTKGDKTLYAFALGWPADRKLVIRSLAQFPGVTSKIVEVALLGHQGKIAWKHTAEGLVVELPEKQPAKYAVALKLTVDDLNGFKPELAAPQAPSVQPDAQGNVLLRPDDAVLHGNLKTEAQGGQPNIGFWDDPADWAAWKANLPAGKYKVRASVAAAKGESRFAVAVGDRKFEAVAPRTEGWEKFAEIEVGAVDVAKAGDQTIEVRPRDAGKWNAINLRWVRLEK